MVKKLFKHEFLSYARVMGLVYGILMAVTIATKLIMTFESDNTIYQIISAFTMLLYVVSVMAALGFSFVMGIVRFYRNMFTCEGYLSFTLPVTAEQHIIVKAVTAVTVNIATTVMLICSGLIMLSGEYWTIFWSEFDFLFSGLFESLGADGVFFAIEAGIALLLSAFTSIMLYYCCISIGQMAKKNRVLAAVGVYFAYYVLTQIVSTIFTVALSVLSMSDAMAELVYWVEFHPIETIHIGLCGSIVLSVVFLLVEFIIIRGIMNKKLNLE